MSRAERFTLWHDMNWLHPPSAGPRSHGILHFFADHVPFRPAFADLWHVQDGLLLFCARPREHELRLLATVAHVLGPCHLRVWLDKARSTPFRPAHRPSRPPTIAPILHELRPHAIGLWPIEVRVHAADLGLRLFWQLLIHQGLDALRFKPFDLWPCKSRALDVGT